MDEFKNKINENEELSPIDCLFDEDNTDPITLFNEKGEKVEFEQIALIPLEDNKSKDNKIYAILKPMETMEGVGEDEALVFEVVESEDDEEEEYLNLVSDLDIIDKVFDVYNKLMDEEDDKNKIDKKK